MIKFLLVNDTTSWRELLANIKVALVGISTERPSHRKSWRELLANIKVIEKVTDLYIFQQCLYMLTDNILTGFVDIID
jgi:hypothetical protein